MTATSCTGDILHHVPLCLLTSAKQRMGMPAVEPRRWTAEAVRALPESVARHECVDGHLLVTPAPRLPHQSVVVLLARVLDAWCTAHGVGALFVAPADVELDPFTLVQPDLFVLPLVHGERPQSVEDAWPALLFAEVLSPSTARADRVLKRQRYQRAGVEYWVVDPDARLVERWRPDTLAPEVCADALTWHPAGAPAPLRIDLVGLFREALGRPLTAW